MRTSSNYALRLPASLKRAVEEVAREDGITNWSRLVRS
jgi:hypothetical protein